MTQRDRRQRSKGRRTRDEFAAFPKQCAQHWNYVQLTAHAKVLLHELNFQYNGKNNGDLCAAWGLLKDRGVAQSRNTVDRARDELQRTGWIVLTRQGNRNAPNLYALTFRQIDDCGGKLDGGALIGRRLDWWKTAGDPRPRSQDAVA